MARQGQSGPCGGLRQNPDKTIYSDLQSVLHYAANEEKTVEGEERAMFVTGVNCNRDTAFQEMQAVKERFGKTGGNVAYHAYQSFKPGEVTPELCHRRRISKANVGRRVPSIGRYSLQHRNLS